MLGSAAGGTRWIVQGSGAERETVEHVVEKSRESLEKLNENR